MVCESSMTELTSCKHCLPLLWNRTSQWTYSVGLETLPWKFPGVAWEPSFGTFLWNLAWEYLNTLPGKLARNIPAMSCCCYGRPQYGRSMNISKYSQQLANSGLTHQKQIQGTGNAKFWRQELLQNPCRLRLELLELQRIKSCQRLTGCKETHFHCRTLWDVEVSQNGGTQ